MKNNQSTPAHTPKDLLDDLRGLVVEAEKMMGESLSGRTDEAVSALRARFDTAHERFSHLYEGAKRQVATGAKITDETIRENPYQSLAVAAGAGLLVGLLLGRRGE
jgi:ElaB/YqjD/DUF883 family membrane-anchored ribosome-binding protein